MYKLKKFRQSYSITKIGDENTPDINFTRDEQNSNYMEFLMNLNEHGLSIVEGSDIKSPGYSELRQKAYPSLEDQLDTIYHEGIDVWKSEIQAVKDQYPKTIEETTTIEDLPEWIQQDLENYNYNVQLNEYAIALMQLQSKSDHLRESAQLIIDETPQEIKDAFNELLPVVEDDGEYAPAGPPVDNSEVVEYI